MTFVSSLEGKKHNLQVSELGKRLGQSQLRRVSNEKQAFRIAFCRYRAWSYETMNRLAYEEFTAHLTLIEEQK